MKQTILRYGAYASVILVLLGLINWFTIAPIGYTLSEIFGYASMVGALIAVPLGIKYYRDQCNDGHISFKTGWSVGMGITLLTSLSMGIYSVLFFYIAGDDFLAWYEDSLSTEDLEIAKEQMATIPDIFFSPWFQGVVMAVTVLLIGFIITLVSALFLKKPAASTEYRSTQ